MCMYIHTVGRYTYTYIYAKHPRVYVCTYVRTFLQPYTHPYVRTHVPVITPQAPDPGNLAIHFLPPSAYSNPHFARSSAHDITSIYS